MAVGLPDILYSWYFMTGYTCNKHSSFLITLTPIYPGSDYVSLYPNSVLYQIILFQVLDDGNGPLKVKDYTGEQFLIIPEEDENNSSSNGVSGE